MLLVIIPVAIVLLLFRALAPAHWFQFVCHVQAGVTFAWDAVVRFCMRNILGQVTPCSVDSVVDARTMSQAIAKIHGSKAPRVKSTQFVAAMTGGFVGKTYKMSVEYEQPASEELPKSFVVKTLTPTRYAHATSIMLGTAREALFYRDFAHLPMVPRYYYTSGSRLSGEFIVVMEDLSDTCVTGSKMTGNQCWGPANLPADIQMSHEEFFIACFEQSADVHAKYWRDSTLLNKTYLKNVDWLQGQNRNAWEFAMQNMKVKWNALKGSKIMQKSEKVVQVMQQAISNTSWEAFRSNFDITKPETAFTLCHGDHHAGNTLWNHSKKHLYWVDYAELGIFCPFTEISQFLVSNATIEVRRKHERDIFAKYHARLLEKAPGIDRQVFTLDHCWQLYVLGGVERWLQMLLLLGIINQQKLLPDNALAWFYDQVQAFVEDHYDVALKSRFMSAYCIAYV